jgi:hypothetical protein
MGWHVCTEVLHTDGELTQNLILTSPAVPEE